VLRNRRNRLWRHFYTTSNCWLITLLAIYELALYKCT